MTDKKFQKQLEAFGIEQTQLVEPDHDKHRRQINFETTLGITKALMNTMEGRHWIFNKLDFCCVNSTPFVGANPHATSFLCGLQEFGHHLQNEVLMAAPNEYALMLQEAAARNQIVSETKQD